jgi:hypothetical protein
VVAGDVPAGFLSVQPPRSRQRRVGTGVALPLNRVFRKVGDGRIRPLTRSASTPEGFPELVVSIAPIAFGYVMRAISGASPAGSVSGFTNFAEDPFKRQSDRKGSGNSPLDGGAAPPKWLSVRRRRVQIGPPEGNVGLALVGPRSCSGDHGRNKWLGSFGTLGPMASCQP